LSGNKQHHCLEISTMYIRPQTRWTGTQLFSTTRAGGVGQAPYDSFNLGMGAGDDPTVVAANRALLRAHLPGDPCWLRQVHGTHVVQADDASDLGADGVAPEGDAAVTTVAGRVLAILTADCLPVVLADVDGTVLGAAHAGWRGLAGGVLEATLSAMQDKSPHARGWRAWVGPGIGHRAFQVGHEVREAFMDHGANAPGLFVEDTAVAGKWLADLAGLAQWRLAGLGVDRIERSGLCTVSDPENRFFSYRRDGQTGRMATLAWLEAS
jgi:YfiH family protein